MRWGLVACCVIVAAVVACGEILDLSVPSDAGVPDAATIDTGAATDSGANDAGAAIDSGANDGAASMCALPFVFDNNAITPPWVEGATCAGGSVSLDGAGCLRLSCSQPVGLHAYNVVTTSVPSASEVALQFDVRIAEPAVDHTFAQLVGFFDGSTADKPLNLSFAQAANGTIKLHDSRTTPHAVLATFDPPADGDLKIKIVRETTGLATVTVRVGGVEKKQTGVAIAAGGISLQLGPFNDILPGAHDGGISNCYRNVRMTCP